MAYKSQPGAGDQRKEKAFRPVPNPKKGDPWPIERAQRLADRVEGLFNRKPSGWPPRDSWMDLGPVIRLMAFGHVQMRLLRLPSGVCAEAHLRRWGGTRAESAEHAQMKNAAVIWMKSSGAKDARDECVHVAGRSDACSIATSWIVECGHTRMTKLKDAIGGMPGGRFTLIPYQPLERWDQSVRPLLAVDFTWDEYATAEVDAFEEKRMSDLADSMAEKMMRGRPAANISGDDGDAA